jgi:hypothetical protein
MRARQKVISASQAGDKNAVPVLFAEYLFCMSLPDIELPVPQRHCRL